MFFLCLILYFHTAKGAIVSAVKKSFGFKVIQVSVPGLCSSRPFDGNADIPDLCECSSCNKTSTESMQRLRQDWEVPYRRAQNLPTRAEFQLCFLLPVLLCNAESASAVPDLGTRLLCILGHQGAVPRDSPWQWTKLQIFLVIMLCLTSLLGASQMTGTLPQVPFCHPAVNLLCLLLLLLRNRWTFLGVWKWQEM